MRLTHTLRVLLPDSAALHTPLHLKMGSAHLRNPVRVFVFNPSHWFCFFVGFCTPSQPTLCPPFRFKNLLSLHFASLSNLPPQTGSWFLAQPHSRPLLASHGLCLTLHPSRPLLQMGSVNSTASPSCPNLSSDPLLAGTPFHFRPFGQALHPFLIRHPLSLDKL